MAVVFDQSETDSLQPARAAKDILVDRGIREEIDRGECRQPENRNLQLMSIRVEVAVRRSEPLESAASSARNKQNVAPVSMLAAKSNALIPRFQNHGSGDTHSFSRVGMECLRRCGTATSSTKPMTVPVSATLRR
jgi:hypothetical protein